MVRIKTRMRTSAAFGNCTTLQVLAQSTEHHFVPLPARRHSISCRSIRSAADLELRLLDHCCFSISIHPRFLNMSTPFSMHSSLSQVDKDSQIRRKETRTRTSKCSRSRREFFRCSNHLRLSSARSYARSKHVVERVAERVADSDKVRHVVLSLSLQRIVELGSIVSTSPASRGKACVSDFVIMPKCAATQSSVCGPGLSKG